MRQFINITNDFVLNEMKDYNQYNMDLRKLKFIIFPKFDVELPLREFFIRLSKYYTVVEHMVDLYSRMIKNDGSVVDIGSHKLKLTQEKIRGELIKFNYLNDIIPLQETNKPQYPPTHKTGYDEVIKKLMEAKTTNHHIIEQLNYFFDDIKHSNVRELITLYEEMNNTIDYFIDKINRVVKNTYW